MSMRIFPLFQSYDQILTEKNLLASKKASGFLGYDSINSCTQK